MAAQLVVAAVEHRDHWYPKEDGSYFHEVALTVKAPPTMGVPSTTGASTVTGTTPLSTRPIWSAWASANQMLPSGPGVIPHGWDPGEMPFANSVITPAGVTLPTRLP